MDARGTRRGNKIPAPFYSPLVHSNQFALIQYEELQNSLQIVGEVACLKDEIAKIRRQLANLSTSISTPPLSSSLPSVASSITSTPNSPPSPSHDKPDQSVASSLSDHPKRDQPGKPKGTFSGVCKNARMPSLHMNNTNMNILSVQRVIGD